MTLATGSDVRGEAWWLTISLSDLDGGHDTVDVRRYSVAVLAINGSTSAGTGMTRGGWLRFDGPLRRRSRLVGRLAASAAHPAMYPSAPIARAFWFDGIANFGDALTPWLLRRAGIVPVLATARTAGLVGVGSILEMLPADYSGYIWGSGSLRGEPLDLPRAQFLAVRGALTRDLVSAPRNVALGDPGLLVSRFLRRQRVRWQLGIVPHHMHEDDPLWPRLAQTPGRRVRIINVRRGPSAVLRDITRCESILSTSLHGLITADSYGIPAVWGQRTPDLWGGRFKFDDYESVVTPGRSRSMLLTDHVCLAEVMAKVHPVDAREVRASQNALLAALASADFSHVNPLTAFLQVRPKVHGDLHG